MEDWIDWQKESEGVKCSQALSWNLFFCFKHHLLQEAFPDLPRVPPWGSQRKSLLITCLLLLFQGRGHGVCSSLGVGIDSLVRDVCTTLTPANTWKFTSNKSTACLGLWIGDRHPGNTQGESKQDNVTQSEIRTRYPHRDSSTCNTAAQVPECRNAHDVHFVFVTVSVRIENLKC